MSATTKFTKIMKNENDEYLFGVLSGLSSYFNVDPFIFRALFFILFLFFNELAIFYIVTGFIMPDYDPEYEVETNSIENDKKDL